MSQIEHVELKLSIQKVIDSKNAIMLQPGRWESWKIWVENTAYKAMSRATCMKILKVAYYRLAELENRPPKGTLVNDEPQIYNGFEYRAKVFEAAVKEYLASIPSKASPLDNRRWFFYFLSVPENTNKHLKIARALLKTGDKNTATVKNVDDGFSTDYTGQYRLLEGSNVACFDLVNNQDSPTRHLHIKVSYIEPDNKIMLGVYTTYDGQLVYSGLLVLEAITDKMLKKEKVQEGKDPEVIICSFKYKKEKFKKINPLIVEYLSDKKKNYIWARKHTPTLDELEVFLKGYKPISNNHNRFLELQKPKLYLALPQGGALDTTDLSKNSPDDLKTLVEEIKELAEPSKEAKDSDESTTLRKPVEFIYKLSADEQSTAFKSENSLKLIQRARYFVIILSEMDKASFSLIQLGWALSYSKYILIISKLGYVSDRILSLSGKTVKQIEYRSLKSEEDRSRIKRAIKDMLETDIEQ